MFIDPLTRALVLRDSAGSGSPPLILMYHGTTPGRTRPSSRYSTTSSAFIEHADIIKKYGWNTVCIRDLESPESLPPRSVAITFDDGYSNNYEGAYLPLLERDMCATWFIVSRDSGHYARWMESEVDEHQLLSHEQLREMASHGMEIGAHTCTHADLGKLEQSAVANEVAGSREELQELLGMDVRSFAYPYGRWNETVIDAVRSAGFTLACSVRPGWVDTELEPFLLRRVTVFADDSPAAFIRKLVFAANDASWKSMAAYLMARIRDRARIWK